MKIERQEELERRLRTSKEKAQEEMTAAASNARKMVRNIDPFERQKRQMSQAQ